MQAKQAQACRLTLDKRALPVHHDELLGSTKCVIGYSGTHWALYLCLWLQAFPQRVTGGLYNGFRPALASCHLEEVVVAASGDILPIATNGTVELVEYAVILIQVAQLQHPAASVRHGN